MINVDYFIKWKELDKEIKKINTRDFVTVFLATNSYNNVFISNDCEGNRSFSVEFDSTTLKDYTPHKTNGLQIEIKNNPNINPEKLYIIVSNVDKANDNAFVGFSVVVFGAIENTTNDIEAINALENVIDDYHNFFGYKKDLSLIEEQGLVAELLYLEKLIKEKGDSTVCNWYGSEKNKRDFIFDTYGVEIKSTLNQKQDIIHVSNENQLDRGSLDNLYLKLYIFDRNETGVTVSDCIQKVYDLIQSAEYKKIFLAKVALNRIDPLGYESKHRFALEKIKTYSIDEKFPKIIKSSIPSETFDVEYNLNISKVDWLEKEE